MGFDRYHEPPDELPPHIRTVARMIASLRRLPWSDRGAWRQVPPGLALRAGRSPSRRSNSSLETP
jgi:hypothetical protein